MSIIVKFKKMHPNAVIPEQGTASAAGFDLCCVEDFKLVPGLPKLVKTGLSIALPPGYEAQIRPRSGLALKHGITVLNSPGTIDADYRGEVGVIIVQVISPKNDKLAPYALPSSFKAGDRIAQLVVQRVPPVQWVEVNELDETERGKDGFGSTGL